MPEIVNTCSAPHSCLTGTHFVVDISGTYLDFHDWRPKNRKLLTTCSLKELKHLCINKTLLYPVWSFKKHVNLYKNNKEIVKNSFQCTFELDVSAILKISSWQRNHKNLALNPKISIAKTLSGSYTTDKLTENIHRQLYSLPCRVYRN